MNPQRTLSLRLLFALLVASTLQAQQPAKPQATPRVAPAAAETQAPAQASPAAANPIAAPAAGLPELASDGYWLQAAPINEVFQYLARRANKQFFHNNLLVSPEYQVTGHLKLEDPAAEMEELATAFGLTVYQKGNSVQLLTEEQVNRLPVEVLTYPLKYLRSARPSSQSLGGGGGAGQGEDKPAASAGSSGIPDYEKIKMMIKPLLTPGTGTIELEEKTNVLVLTDNAARLQRITKILDELDKPRQQIVINVRILRVRQQKGRRTGINWNSTLGEGLPLGISQNLNTLFNLPESSTLTNNNVSTTGRKLTSSNGSNGSTSGATGSLNNSTTTVTTNASGTTTTTVTNNASNSSNGSTTGTTNSLSDSLTNAIDNTATAASEYVTGAGLVFNPLEVNAILHALRTNNLVSQESCPSIITEDNEQGVISLVDRFPIIIAQTNASQSNTSITDRVRYKVDEDDPDAAQQPDKSREIGVTLTVTPTIMPDGTIRMKLRPRVANIVELVASASGNRYPRVSESTVEGISRIPDGRSLILGGFYSRDDRKGGNSVPVLGRIPLLGRLFRYDDDSNELVSLVFIITPKVYDATSGDLDSANLRMQDASGVEMMDPELMPNPLLPPVSGRMRNPPSRILSPATAQQPLTPPATAAPAAPKRNLFQRLFNR